MDIALLSLLALVGALLLSMFSRVNVGLISIAVAWLIGVYAAGLTAEAVASGFPLSLFLTLAGVTLLFALAESNGSVSVLAQRALSRVGGNPRLIPLALFWIAAILAALGPGAIAAVALLIPVGMAISTRTALPPLLTALMVANGANAGNLSPISLVGIIADQKLAAAGFGGHAVGVMFANLLANALVAGCAYIWLIRRVPARSPDVPKIGDRAGIDEAASNLDRRRSITLIVLACWILCVVLLKVSLGLSAFLAASLLILLRVANQDDALRRMPWGIILMVCGVSVLVALLERNGGLELFSKLLSELASPATINGVIAFVTGVISSYSSTSGVVLPTFLPTVPALVSQLGGGDPLAIALSITIGSTLVDVSPLSTLGALCVAAVADPQQSRRLFYQLLAWGLSMTVVGALLCQLFAGAFAAII